jgi:Domain of unknown function (DUF4389)
MTDEDSATADPAPSGAAPKRVPFPLTRLFYAIGFAFVAWVVFWLALFVGLAQWIMTAVAGDHDDQLKHWSRNLNQYLWEVLSFIVFARDDKPFPFGPFPRM